LAKALYLTRTVNCEVVKQQEHPLSLFPHFVFYPSFRTKIPQITRHGFSAFFTLPYYNIRYHHHHFCG